VETYAPALLQPAAAGAFWAVWSAAVGSALWPARSSHRGSLLVLVGNIAAAGALAAAAADRLRAAGLGDGWLWYGVGAGLIFSAGAVRAWSLQSAPSPPSGPYRLVRHPGYTAVLLALAGFGLGLDNLVALLAAVVVPLPAIAYRIAVEERAAAGAPGRTARLIPGIW
jgi:protein-S-isoprenylcysteine O-methyltransferase Ste14